jgi:hypothetical protein
VDGLPRVSNHAFQLKPLVSTASASASHLPVECSIRCAATVRAVEETLRHTMDDWRERFSFKQRLSRLAG